MWVYIETLPSTSWPIAKNYFETSSMSIIESDPDAGQHLAQILVELAYAFTLLHQINYPIEMTALQQIEHNLTTHCQLCHREFAPKINQQDLLKNIGHGGNRVRLLLYNNYLIKTQFVCELEC